MQGLANCKDNDIIFISDCDEIWNPSVLERYKGGICSLKQWHCYYKFNTVDTGSIYTKGAKLCNYSDLLDPKQDIGNVEYCSFSRKGLPTYLRFCNGKKLYDAGWHFSYVNSTENIILKREAIVEQQFNTSENMNPDNINKMIEEGQDILGRGSKYMNINPDDILPIFILKNINKYSKYISNKNLISVKKCFFLIFLSKLISIQNKDDNLCKNKILNICGIKINLSKIFSIAYENNNKNNRKIINFLGIKIKLKKKNRNLTIQDKDKYLEYVLNQQLDDSNFVNDDNEIYKSKDNDVKLIAYYLPQYHAIPENDKWFRN